MTAPAPPLPPPGRHSARATVALQRLAERDPAFAALSLWCVHRDVDHAPGSGAALAPIAWTDGRTVFYGPGFADLPLPERSGVCAHEILHIAFRHVPRAARLRARLGGILDPLVFNIAADGLINETLLRAGHALPRDRVNLGDVLALIGEANTPPSAALGRFDVETLCQRLIEAAAASPDARAAVLALAVAADLPPDPAGGAGQGAGAADTLEDMEWGQRVAGALSHGAAAGRGLGAVNTRLADLPRSRTPWERILRGAVGKALGRAARSDWSRPSRRWLALDVDAAARAVPRPGYEPSMRALPDRPRAAVCLDVSASIGEALLKRFAAEIAGIARRTGAELHLVVFDDGVQLQTRVEGPDFEAALAALKFKGRGGTSFAEPVEAALEVDPSIIVVLTDLNGPFGPAPRGVPLIWACPDANAPAPPFGRVVVLER